MQPKVGHRDGPKMLKAQLQSQSRPHVGLGSPAADRRGANRSYPLHSFSFLISVTEGESETKAVVEDGTPKIRSDAAAATARRRKRKAKKSNYNTLLWACQSIKTVDHGSVEWGGPGTQRLGTSSGARPGRRIRMRN